MHPSRSLFEEKFCRKLNFMFSCRDNMDCIGLMLTISNISLKSTQLKVPTLYSTIWNINILTALITNMRVD